MSEMNDSKYNMMRGMIALAWADDRMDAGERSLLERYIDANRHFTPEQRTELKASIDQPITIADVWESITDIHDRARLIDVAGAIFHADGDYSASEKKVYDEMLAMHLTSLNKKATELDIKRMAEQAQRNAKKEEAEYITHTKQSATPITSKVGFLMFRINKALGQ